MTRSRIAIALVWCVLLVLHDLILGEEPAVPSKTVEPGQASAEESLLCSKTLDTLNRVMLLPESQRASHPLAGTASLLLFQTQSLPPDQRYRLLKSWTLPASGNPTIRQFAGYLPDAPPPPAFLGAEQLPAADDLLISLPTLLVEAARDAGKLDELTGELTPYVAARTEGAERLFQLVELERGNPQPLRTGLFELIARRQSERPVSFGNQRVTQQLLDGLLMKAALGHPETRNAGLHLHSVLLGSAKQSANFGLIVWLYRTGGLAAIADVKGATLRPSMDPGLKHWGAVDVASADNCTVFGTLPWWVAVDDQVGHVCAPWIDHLVFAYPLTGTFEISCESFNGYWSEANLGYGGLVFEPWSQGSDNQFYPVNQHEVIHGPNPREFLDQFNPMTIRVTPNLLQVSGINQVLFEDSSPSRNSPFFFLRTTWLSAFRKLRISGTPVIPREVALLEDNRMEGWVTSFYNESQPRTFTDPGSLNPQEFDWAVADGVLHGRRVAATQAGSMPARFQHDESWVYFPRPLREGERIRYEFFYQPGDDAIEVHPTLDRLVFRLQPDGVTLHWLTTNRTEADAGGWIATDNTVEEPENRRGPKRLPFRLNNWNSALLEIRGGQVQVELNGELVYSRSVEPTMGARFGLYHRRSRSAARVRNIVLSGDWPEWSPELGTNLFEPTSPLSPENAAAIRMILAPRLNEKDNILRRTGR